ncbi:hypothetical protein N0V90_010666 [Kalmusia sp. IMI 367209]|nr:hypothetical protein N0V90_010666 [Kalmusia sp. IMI 367209]
MLRLQRMLESPCGHSAPYRHLPAPLGLAAMLFFLFLAAVTARPAGHDTGRVQEGCIAGHGQSKSDNLQPCASFVDEVSGYEESREVRCDLSGLTPCEDALNYSEESEGRKEQPTTAQPVTAASIKSTNRSPSSTHRSLAVPMSRFVLKSSSEASMSTTISTLSSTSTSLRETPVGSAGPMIAPAPPPMTTETLTITTATTDLSTLQMSDPSQSSTYSDNKPLNGSVIGGIVVGIIAGVSLLSLALYVLLRRCKARKSKRNVTTPGLLPGPRVPTGSSVHSSRFHRSACLDSDDATNDTLLVDHAALPCSYGKFTLAPTSNFEASPKLAQGPQQYAEQEIHNELHNAVAAYSSSSMYSRPGDEAIKGHASGEHDYGNVSHASSTVREPQLPLFSPWSVDDDVDDNDDAVTHHNRSSNGSLNWPLPKSTVSSPALLTTHLRSQAEPSGPLTDAEADKEQAEKAKHRRAAERALSGLQPSADDAKQPGSVARARQNMLAAQEASKKPGSVAHARQNMVAVQDFGSEDDDEDDVEVSATGTVVRRKSGKMTLAEVLRT